MLDTTKIFEYIKEQGKSEFDSIWNALYIANENEDEFLLKSRTYLSMIQDFRFIKVESNLWDLKEKYSLQEIEDFQNSYYENVATIEENDLDGFETDVSNSPVDELTEEDSLESSLDYEEDESDSKFDI